MSRVEYVLIGTDDSFDDTSHRIGEILDVAADPTDGEHLFPLAGGGWAALDPEPFDAWTDERFRGYRWRLAIGGLASRSEAEQEAAAARVYEQLMNNTSWALALAFDHADALVAVRGAGSPHAGRKGVS